MQAVISEIGFACYVEFVQRSLMEVAKTLLLFGAIIVFGCSHARAQRTFPFHDETRYDQSGERGRVEIAIKGTTLRRGELAALDYTFFNTNGSYWVYNWQFSSLIPLPGQLAIYDSEKHYIGDLIQWEGGSRKGAGDDDWLFLYGGCHIGRAIGFRTGYVPLTKYGTTQNLLPPGKYFIQLILYKTFFSTNPSYIVGDQKPNWYD